MKHTILSLRAENRKNKCVSIFKYNFILFNKLNGFKCVKPFSLTNYVIAIAHYMSIDFYHYILHIFDAFLRQWINNMLKFIDDAGLYYVDLTKQKHEKSVRNQPIVN